jgi:hypothetical protein
MKRLTNKPMSYADSLTEKKSRSVKLTEVEKYLENWQEIIDFSRKESIL